MSTNSQRDFDNQEAFMASPSNEALSAEIMLNDLTIKDGDLTTEEDVDNNFQSLAEKLSAALMNVRAKEDLVKQHAKVGEEAIAGWEKAENEVTVLKQQFGSAIKQKSALEDQVSHLDAALKECVRQLRQTRDEQEQKIHEAVKDKITDFESVKLDLERQIHEIQTKAKAAHIKSAHADFVLSSKVESLEKENSALRHELYAQSEELEIRTIERDLSTQAAETASKQILESLKKVARVEAECRKLKARATPPSSSYVESLTDSQSDGGEHSIGLDIDTHNIKFKNEKVCVSNLPSSMEISLMDDFLEMEKLAAIPESDTGNGGVGSESIDEAIARESSLRVEIETLMSQTMEIEEKLEKMEDLNAELEEKLVKMMECKDELEQKLEKMKEENHKLEEKLEKIKREKTEMEISLDKSKDCTKISEIQLKETETKVEELEKELIIANDSKQSMEALLVSMEAESQTLSEKFIFLEHEVEKERAFSDEMKIQCHELEEELIKMKEDKIRRRTSNEPKIKQEDLAAAAGKLAECQKTIASLGNQLKSLVTLDDFLTDTTSIAEFSEGICLVSKASVHKHQLSSNGSFSPKRVDYSEIADVTPSSKNEDNSPPSSSSSSASSVLVSAHVSSEKNRNGFAKFFSRTKSGIRLEI